MPHTASTRPRRIRHLRRLPLLASLALVLVAHAWLLGGLPGMLGAAEMVDRPDRAATRSPSPVLQTRTVVLKPADAETPTLPPPSTAQAPAPTPRRPGPVVERPRPRPALAAVAPAVHDPVVLVAAASASASAPTDPPAAVAAAAEGADVPTYKTRLPPAARLTYELRRGAARGSGELGWAPAEAAYTLSLQGRAIGLLLIGWDSQGGFDAAGIAPERYVDSRRGRESQAANFRRDSGRITFSGPATELPLAPGTQDRLSWMLQLPAIIEAEPARFAPGAQISMWVVGARGDMGVWTFAVEAREAIAVPAGRIEGALRLKREPRKAYDTLVEVWLDPARHHLPAKVRMSIPQTGDMTEFSLQAAGQP